MNRAEPAAAANAPADANECDTDEPGCDAGEPVSGPAGVAEPIADELVRPALELGFAVAVLGSRQRPPLPVPGALRPYLRFQKLPAAALGPLRRAIDGDEEYRERVALIADEEVLGRASYLWLARPDGWSDELAKIAAAERDATTIESFEQPATRRTAKRIEAIEQALARARLDADELRRELVALKARRDDDASARPKLESKVGQLEIELGGARRRLAAAEAERDAARDAVAAAEQRARAADERAAAAEARAVSETRPVAGAPTDDVATAAPHADDIQVDAPRDVDGAAVTDLAREAANASRALADVLDALHGALRERKQSGVSDGAPGAGGGRRSSDAAAAPIGTASSMPPLAATSHRQRPPAHRLRRPLRLPGGVLADSGEAAEFLLRQRVPVIVDGYNVAKLGWPGLELADQRERLLHALREVVARFGTELRVVFDGADVGRVPVRIRTVQVTFSPAGILADDVVVQFVEALPAEQSVVVVTNDRELRSRVGHLGATVLGSAGLLAAARR